MWFTPIVYPVTTLPDTVRELLVWNPMASVVAAYQNILVRAQMPQWGTLIPVTVLALFFCAVGLQLFRKRAGEMVDEL